MCLEIFLLRNLSQSLGPSFLYLSACQHEGKQWSHVPESRNWTVEVPGQTPGLDPPGNLHWLPENLVHSRASSLLHPATLLNE